jgi:hypothetical protein
MQLKRSAATVIDLPGLESRSGWQSHHCGDGDTLLLLNEKLKDVALCVSLARTPPVMRFIFRASIIPAIVLSIRWLLQRTGAIGEAL